MKIERLIIIVLIFLLFLAIGIGIWAIFRPTFILTGPSPSPSLLPEVVSPTQKPELEATVSPSPSLSPSPVGEATESDEVLIKEAIAEKHGKSVSEANLSIGENDGIYATGVVSFAGEIAGGWWLAAKTSGEWVIVADGNGTVLCDDIKDYNFPISMVEECWDEATQQLVKM